MASLPDIHFGVMFHHFHDGKQHPYIQGALDAEQFEHLLTAETDYTFIDANLWLEKFENNTLSPKELCVTFDDALLSQYEIARPVLDKLGIKALWFVYSGIFEGVIETLEVHRYFRNVSYKDMDAFYVDFFNQCRTIDFSALIAGSRFDGQAFDAIIGSEEAVTYLAEHDYYTREDRQYRFVRDVVLSGEQFNHIMDHMMAANDFVPEEWAKRMWLDDSALKTLHDTGHVLGLHSYSHPVNFRRLDMAEQVNEYFRNAMHLMRVVGSVPDVMAHPSNSYNEITLEILKGFGVKYGFRSDPVQTLQSNLEIPRIDHPDYMRHIAAYKSLKRA